MPPDTNTSPPPEQHSEQHSSDNYDKTTEVIQANDEEIQTDPAMTNAVHNTMLKLSRSTRRKAEAMIKLYSVNNEQYASRDTLARALENQNIYFDISLLKTKLFKKLVTQKFHQKCFRQIKNEFRPKPTLF